MKAKNIFQLFALALITVMLASCSTSNQVASSFGKRKYMKGYYVNIPSAANNVTTSTKKADEAVSKTDEQLTKINNAPAQETEQSVKTANAEKKNTSAVLINKSSSSQTLKTSTEKKTITEKQYTDPPAAITDGGGRHHGDTGGNSSLNWAAVAGIFFAFLFTPLGLLFSIIGLSSQNKNLAVAGLILSIIVIILAFVWIFAFVGIV